MNTPEDEIQAVVKILEDEECDLSDGYEYYCGGFQNGVGGVKGKLRQIAIKIITQLSKV